MVNKSDILSKFICYIEIKRLFVQFYLTFFSTLYKRKTRNIKYIPMCIYGIFYMLLMKYKGIFAMIKTQKNKKNQSGRSMVEMLGVLAIIGVLSVGGIAGYKTAMDIHAFNEFKNTANILYISYVEAIEKDSKSFKLKVGKNSYNIDQKNGIITTYTNETYPYIPKEKCQEVETFLQDTFGDYYEGARLKMKDGNYILLGGGWVEEGSCSDAVDDFSLSGLSLY